MTIPRYLALRAHWRRFPRPEWLIAAYLGFKGPQEETPPRWSRAAGLQAAAPRVAPPPTGALQTLFASLGGKPGQTVVMS